MLTWFQTWICASLVLYIVAIPQHQKLTARKLYTFRSYKDVQLFHFRSPAETRNVTFSLTAAELNSNCPPRQVTIYVQHGSYPVFPMPNARFPDNFYHRRTSLSHRTIMSDSVAIQHTVPAPLPGDWFLAAFIVDNSSRIRQKGLSRACDTTLKSQAVFHRQSNVISLIPEVTNHQQLILTQKINDTQFYKFLVPSGVDEVTVNVSKCDRKDDGGGFFRCPLVLSARPLALPQHDSIYTGMTNCSLQVSGVCVLRLKSSPGAWHYVRLDVLPGTAAQFGIQILLDRGCMDVVPTNNDYLLVSEMRCEGSPRTAFIPVTFSNGAAPARRHRTSSAACRHRVPLGRLSMPGTMTFVYDQLSDSDTEWTSAAASPAILSSPGSNGFSDREPSWTAESETNVPPKLLNVSTSRPTVMSFNLEPGHDIGGTLTVALTLPDNTDVSIVNVSVVACLALWRHALVEPDGQCSDGVRLEVNSTSTLYSNVTSVPFPEPGDWYLTLMARCYLQDHHRSANSYIPCPRNQTSLMFHIESAPCVQGRCAGNGNCLQYYSGGYVFSTCSCWAGYTGWGCTDARFATSEFELLLGTLLLTLSNLLFAPAVALAIRRSFYTEALVYALTMLCSTFYHACDEDKYSFCLLRLSVLQFGDFYCGIFAFWTTLVAMSHVAPLWSCLLNVAGATAIALGVEYDRTGLWVFVVPVATAISFMIGAWVQRCRLRRGMFPSVRYLLLGLVPGAAVAGAGLICYAFLETRDNYKYTHSAWHCCVAVSVLFLLPTKRRCVDQPEHDGKQLYCVTAHHRRADGGADVGSMGDSTGSRGKLLQHSVESTPGGGGVGGPSAAGTPQRQMQQHQQHHAFTNPAAVEEACR